MLLIVVQEARLVMSSIRVGAALAVFAACTVASEIIRSVMTVSLSRSFVLIGALLVSVLAFPLLAQPVSVSVSPSAAALATGETWQFTATVTGSANMAVTWSISPSMGTISAAGLYTAPSMINSTSQTVTVTAT